MAYTASGRMVDNRYMNPDKSQPLVTLPKLDLSRLVLALRHSNAEAREQVGRNFDMEG